jgi:hypothetical protein
MEIPMVPQLLTALLLVGQASANPIINGIETDDIEPVGAIGFTQGGYIYGPFCSGTLINYNWVVTAAHCVEAFEEYERHLGGGTGVFMTGGDIAGGAITDYATVTDAISHPNYTPQRLEYDIGLLQLQGTGIRSAGIMPVNRDVVGNTWVGKELRYVGFGVTDRYGGTQGAGTKRYADIPVWQYDRTYIYGYDPDDGQNVCSGDSGGAALEIVGEDQYEIAAVNSTVFAPYGGESCRDGATAGVRIDEYLGWIEGYTEVVTAAEYYQEEPEEDPTEDPTEDPEDTAWTDLPDRPSEDDINSWGGTCSSAPPARGLGLLALLTGLAALVGRREQA